MNRIPKPTKARILVQPIHAEPRVGAIHIPDAAREQRPAEASVLAIGPKVRLPLKVGDRVLIARYNGIEVRQGTSTYRLMEEEDLLAVVE